MKTDTNLTDPPLQGCLIPPESPLCLQPQFLLVINNLTGKWSQLVKTRRHEPATVPLPRTAALPGPLVSNPKRLSSSVTLVLSLKRFSTPILKNAWAYRTAVAHTFNSSTERQRQVDISKFKVCLVYRLSSRIARVSEKPYLRRGEENKQTNPKKNARGTVSRA